MAFLGYSYDDTKQKMIIFSFIPFSPFCGNTCVFHSTDLLGHPKCPHLKYVELAISKEFFCGDAKMSHYLNSPHNAAVSIFKSPKECRVNACMGGCVCMIQLKTKGKNT